MFLEFIVIDENCIHCYSLKFIVIDGEYIVNISTGIVKHVCKVILFRFVKVRYKIPLIRI